jgi:ABC-type branched-subunit amino acid transport system substrate-binding protein
LAAATLLGLAACAPQSPAPGFVGTARPIGAPQPAPLARAALLLPLSGQAAPLGQAMLNAATMALFDEAPTSVEFLPRDTAGTPAGAAAAARQALADGARAIIGPLTSAEAAAVAPVARGAGVPMVAFTNDAQRTGENAWVLGITPQQQVRRIVSATAREGAQRFVLAAPNTEFGRALADGLRSAASDLRLPPPAIALHPASADPAMAAGAARAAAPQADALLLGEGGERARRFVAAYAAEARAALADGVAPSQGPELLGTALWLNDPVLRAEGALAGARFPGPDSTARARFEQRYAEAFRDAPPRVAATAYDTAALTARALRSGAPLGTVTASGAFDGADGPVRLLPGGQTLRGLAIYTLSATGEALLLEAAPAPAGAGF